MLRWIIQIALISLIFIFLVHHLISFFTSILTVPKIKDLVDTPKKKYENIFNTILNSNNNDSNNNINYTNIDLLPSTAMNDETLNMKDELKNFLKKQLNNEDINLNTYENSNNLFSLNYDEI